jgi:Family of unknown function (DUF6220)
MNAARTIYRYLIGIVFLGVIVQVGLAGYGAFYTVNHVDDDPHLITKHRVEHGWDPHSAWGTILGIIALILLIDALIARFDSRLRNWNIALFVLFLLQVLLLAPLGGAVPGLGWLHPVNALAIFGISGWLAHRAWRGWESAPEPAPLRA